MARRSEPSHLTAVQADFWPAAHPSPRSCPSPAASSLFDFLRSQWHNLEALPPHAMEKLSTRLDRLQAEDLGLSPRDSWRLRSSHARVGYQDVYSGPELTLCIFVLAAGACIPLHDHPDMDVFGRLLYGRMRVVSFDPEPVLPPVPLASGSRPPTGSRWAYRRPDVIVGPAPTTYTLGPGDGNIHELHALEDCAFFDVVVPPYDPAAGRNCTYYGVASSPQLNQEANGRVLLVPTSARDFMTESLDYKGPRFDPPSPTCF